MTHVKLKVLFLTSSYPRSRDDTASLFLRYLAESVAASGVDVHVLAPAEKKGGTTIENSVTVHRFQYLPAAWQGLAYGSGMLPNLKRLPWLWLQVPFFVLAMTLSLLRLQHRLRFDLIHAHWILPQGLVGLVATRTFRVPLLVTVHGTDAYAFRGILATRLKQSILRGAAAWTANTTNTAAALKGDSDLHPPHIVPMGVEIALFSSGNPALLRRELPEGESLLLFVGRLIENKGCRDLIEALSRLPEKIRERTTLWVVGDGDERETLARAASDLSVGPKVRFFGFMDHKKLIDFYAAADVVVVPSKTGSAGEVEGQGLVVLEAFAARKCVIAARVGGIPSMVRHRSTGVLVESDNPAALSQALHELLIDSALRQQLADAAFTEVIERYSWTQIETEFRSVYRDVLAPAEQKGRHI